MTTTSRISRLPERVGVPATTPRFPEKEGLLGTDRSPAGSRHDGEADAERIRFISAAKRLGLPLDRIRDLLQVWDGGMCSLGHLSRLPAKDGQCDAACAFLHVRRSGSTALRSTPRSGPPAPHAVEAPVACSLDAAGYRDRAADWQRLLAETDRAGASC